MSAVMERAPNGAISSAIMEKVLIGGDLSKLTAPERVEYYGRTCASLGLNPTTQPFAYISLNGKLQLYARKDATEQLRKLHGVSIERLEKENVDGVYCVTAYAKDKSGRTDASIGAVNIASLKGEALANALMKAETKAKRRATLSICGLGMLDETETETIQGAVVMPHDAIPATAEPAPATARVSEQSMNDLPPADQIELRSLAEEVKQKLANESADAALDLLCSFGLDSDKRVAIWSQFTSAERTSLKKADKRLPRAGF